MTGQKYSEHEDGPESLGTPGKDADKIGGRYPGVRNILQVSGTGNSAVWFVFAGHIVSNVEDCVGYAHRVVVIDHEKSGMAKSRRDVGDTGSKGSSGGSEDALSGHVHWSQAGDCVIVGGDEIYI